MSFARKRSHFAQRTIYTTICNGDWKAVTQAQHRVMYGECKETCQVLMENTRNYFTDGADKHKTMCQELCQEELSEKVHLNQCVAMRVGLKYEGHDHEKAAMS